MFSVNSPTDDSQQHYGRTKEAYEGDSVSLTCSDDNPGGRFSTVIFKYQKNTFNLCFI